MLVLSGCALSPSGSKYVCQVGDGAITKGEFQTAMAGTYKKADAATKKDLLNQLVDDELLAQYAHAHNLEPSEEAVNTKLFELKHNFFADDDKLYRETMKKQGTDEDKIKNALRHDLEVELASADIVAQTKITDKELHAYWQTHKNSYTTPYTRHVLLIQLPTKAAATSLRQTLTTANFSQMAREKSTDTETRANGGKLTVRDGDTLPALVDAVRSIATNTISAPIETPIGWYLILPEDTAHEGTTLTYNEAHDAVFADVQDAKTQTAVADEIKKLRKKTKIDCSGAK